MRTKSENETITNGEESSLREPAGQPALLGLFGSFLRLGATAFGGPAMVAYIRQMAVDRNRWRALEWLGTIDARGGTEMGPALQQAVELLAGVDVARCAGVAAGPT